MFKRNKISVEKYVILINISGKYFFRNFIFFKLFIIITDENNCYIESWCFMIGWKTFWEKNVTSKYGTYTYHIQETTQLFFVSTALPNSRQIVKFVSRNYARNFMRRDRKKHSSTLWWLNRVSLSIFFSWSVPENRGSKRRLRWLSFTVCGFIELNRGPW